MDLKERQLLLAVRLVSEGVDIERDSTRRLLERIHKGTEEPFFQRQQIAGGYSILDP